MSTDGLGGPVYNPETHFLQPRIAGYRQLSGNEADDINAIKKREFEVAELFAYLRQPGNNYDQRWLAIAKTDLQRGFMALVRAVAQPEDWP